MAQTWLAVSHGCLRFCGEAATSVRAASQETGPPAQMRSKHARTSGEPTFRSLLTDAPRRDTSKGCHIADRIGLPLGAPRGNRTANPLIKEKDHLERCTDLHSPTSETSVDGRISGCRSNHSCGAAVLPCRTSWSRGACSRQDIQPDVDHARLWGQELAGSRGSL
jgi:hypothetical protein